MDKTQALQKLLNGTASEEEINLLKHGLASGEISIGGDVNHSVIIIGSGNTVELPPAALDRLGGRSLLGDLDRDLTGDEIANGLNRLEAELPLRAPVLLTQFQKQIRRLRPSLKTNAKSLSDQARRERFEALAQTNSLCIEVLDIAFNALCLGEEPPEYDSRSPFRGLESFRPEDSEFFFGREALTKKLVGKINSHPFLAVLGASGSGKSSLVMAGLIPALGSEYVVFRPGTNPLEAVEAVKENALVVVDQFEELFTLTRDEATRKEFITRLLETTKRSKVVITLRSDFLGEVGAYHSLKEEIQSHLEIIPPMDTDELRRAMEGQASQVGLRFEADLSQQILDDVEGEPGAMPLLQHALWELWNRRHGRNLRASEYRAFGGVKQAITSTAEKVYGECTKEEKEQVCDIFLRLTRLDDSDEGRDTRRRVAMNDLIPSGRDTDSITLLLDKLANARLVVKNVNEDKTEIEVAHEALIRHWERLRGWLNEDRDNLRLRESVSEPAKEWEKSGRDESLLNSRWVKLDEALLLAQDSRYRLTEIERAYIDGCIRLRVGEKAIVARRRRYIFSGVSAAAVIIVAILAGWGWTSNENSKLLSYQVATAQVAKINAKQQAIVSRANELAAQTLSLQEKDFSLSLLMGIIAFNTMDNYQTRGALLSNIQANMHLVKFISGNYAKMVAFSQDGNTLVTVDWYDNITLWDATTGMTVDQIFTENIGYIGSPSISSDGKIIALGRTDGEIILWSVSNKEPICHQINENKAAISSLAFSHDGKVLASGSEDSIIILWDVESCQQMAQLLGHTSRVVSLAFNPESKILASGDSGNKIILWNVADRKITGELTNDFATPVNNQINIIFSPDNETLAVGGCRTKNTRLECVQSEIVFWDLQTKKSVDVLFTSHTGEIQSMAISSDGKFLISGSTDGTIILWDLLTRRPINQPLDAFGSVNSLAFGPDNKTFASTGSGGIILWNVDINHFIYQPLTDHSHSYRTVAFSPDDKLVTSGSDDDTIILWDVATRQPVGQPLRGHSSWVSSVAFSPDGKILASGSDDNTIILWDVASRQPIGQPLKGHSSWITSVAFSPDGKILASGSGDHTIIIWDIDTHQPIGQPLTSHRGNVESVAFSPDGKKLASVAEDGNLIMWHVSSHAIIGIDKILQNAAASFVVFNSDGTILATLRKYGGDIIFLDPATLELAGRLKGDPYTSGGVAFSSDGRLFASGDPLILWDLDTFQPFAPPISTPYGVARVAFSHDGNALATVTGDKMVLGGPIILWDINPQHWIDKTCQRVGRNFTRAEWNQYIGDALPYQAVCPNLPIEAEPTPTP
ncbi:MAG: PD40 domain-containing protein [Chloroflexi bacterium]|nr:PD40 domain-containing protein [Chloroflexota bacterium]